MTDKRYVQFEFTYDDFGVKDNKTNEELWNPEVVNRLNEQEEIIQSLKERIKALEKEVYELSQGEADWITEEMI